MARNIFNICIQPGIYLEIQWIPRTLNQQADFINRLLDTDDWWITDDLFLSLDARWGPHTVDCFANYYNHKLPRFFSRFWNPNTTGVDFFFQPLREENCWVVPPVSIVPRVQHYMKCQKAVGTVVVPFWPSAHFWPLVTSKYLKYVSDYSMHIGNQSLVHGRNPNSLLGSEHFKGYIIALINRLLDTDDWWITDDLFLSLDARWGPHTVDCFANYYNHKLPRFFSRFWNPNTTGVDFFFQPLREENCWVVPPVSIVPRVQHYMKCQKAVGTVVVPFWPSAHFWPLVTSKYLKYVSDYSMHIGNQSLVHGRNPNSLLGSEHFKGYIIALRMEFID